MKALFCSSLAVLALITFGCQSDDSSWSGPGYTPAAGSWAWQNPLPHGNGINDVVFTSADVGWAIGNGGMLLRSTDGGLSWSERNSGTDMDLTTVFFSDAITGWIGGGYFEGIDEYYGYYDSRGVLLHTSDGGVTWYERSTGSSAMFLDIQFLGNDHGWAAGTSGTVLRTTDGGESWDVHLTDSYRNISSVCFTDQMNGWVVTGNEERYSYSTIQRTTDGGVSWHQILGYQENLFDIVFQNPDTGWAVGSNGSLLHIVDADSSWFSASSGVSQTLRHLYVKDAQRLWIAGDGGTLLYSIDAGATWTLRESGSTASLRSLAFSSGNIGVAVGKYGAMMHTMNGGLWWIPDGQSVSMNDLNATSFFNENTGWAVGDNGTVLHTADGGQSWETQSSGTSADLYDVEFVDALHGWAVGGYDNDYVAVVLSTADGGASWNEQQFGGVDAITSLDMYDGRVGWATGSSGFALKTEDGGMTWEIENAPLYSYSLSDICMTGDSSIWISSGGYSGAMFFHSINGGQDWTSDRFNGLGAASHLTFINEDIGWACGSNGLIMHTADEGASWTIQPSGTSRTLNSITFLDANYGWAVGEHGVLLFTTDGGVTWTPSEFRNGNTLKSVALTRAGHGWAVGEGGTILHFTPTAPIL